MRRVPVPDGNKGGQALVEAIEVERGGFGGVLAHEQGRADAQGVAGAEAHGADRNLRLTPNIA